MHLKKYKNFWKTLRIPEKKLNPITPSKSLKLRSNNIKTEGNEYLGYENL